MEAEQFLTAAEMPSQRARAKVALEAHGRVQLSNFLPSDAALSLAKQLEIAPWDLHFNEGGQPKRIPYSVIDEMAASERDGIFAAITQRAQVRPEFFSDTYHITERYLSGENTNGPLAQVHGLLNSERGLSALRGLVNDERVAYVDVFGARYRAGQFLAPHTDLIPGEERLFAYVLNLSPRWHVHWGGQLLFFDDQGVVTAGFSPRFGALNIFKVPQIHSVSVVAPFAAVPRFSISGWLHAKHPPR